MVEEKSTFENFLDKIQKRFQDYSTEKKKEILKLAPPEQLRVTDYCLKREFQLFLVGIIALFMFSCSNELTRQEAEKVIKQNKNLPYYEVREFTFTQTKRFVGRHPRKEPWYDESYIKVSDIKPQPKRNQLFESLVKAGLITYEMKIDRIKAFDPCKNEVWVEGKVHHIAGPTDRTLVILGNQVVVSTIEFGEITGIVERKEFNIAEVQYTLVRKNVTPFGKLVFKLNEKIMPRNVTFTRYDDGWRINK